MPLGPKMTPHLGLHALHIQGAFIIYCNCHLYSHAIHEIPMKSNTGNSSIFYLSMDTGSLQFVIVVFQDHTHLLFFVPIGALVFVLLALVN